MGLFADLLNSIFSSRDAVIGLLGIVVGGLMTLIVDLIIGARATRLKLREQLLNRRIESYESLLTLAHKLLKGYALPYPKSKPFNKVKIPAAFETSEKYSEFLEEFTASFQDISWLSWDTSVSLRVMQTYFNGLNDFVFDVMEPLVTLEFDGEAGDKYDQAIDELVTSFLWEIGSIILHDFIGFSGLIEKSAFAFYRWGLWSLRLSNPRSRHKWEIRSERMGSIARITQNAMFRQTQLIKQRVRLEEIGAEYRIKARKLREEFTKN